MRENLSQEELKWRLLGLPPKEQQKPPNKKARLPCGRCVEGMQKSELDRVAADVKNRRVSVVVVNHGVREVFLNNLGTCVHAIFWRICVEKFLIAIHIRRRKVCALRSCSKAVSGRQPPRP